MRLLEFKNEGEFSLTEFLGDNIPPYAALSHTWRPDGNEVTFKDLLEGTGESKIGYKKIVFCGEQARRDGLRYFWVDTCCIDKASSAELTEAINSMFRWYREANRCYVYLADVSIHDHNNPDQRAFYKSRWFTRGWTLQELIAPASVEFFTLEGKRLGDKRSMERQVHEITGIAVQALRGNPLSDFSVSERLSWAKHRTTTRKEDEAYSLLGIFDVHMPLIYGEGEKAFKRLKVEIDRNAIALPLSTGHDIVYPGNTASNLDQKLADIQSSILEVHQAVLSQTGVIRYNMTSADAGQLALTNRQFPGSWNRTRGFLDSTTHNNIFHFDRSGQSKEDPDDIPKSEPKKCRPRPELEGRSAENVLQSKKRKSNDIPFPFVASGIEAPPGPASSFETLPGFFPELYCVDQQLHISSLIVTGYSQESLSKKYRTNSYRIFYLKSSRQWRRLNISITLSSSSPYWGPMQLSQLGENDRDALPLIGAAALPQSVAIQIQRLLSDIPDLKDDAHFNFSVSKTKITRIRDQEPQICAPPTNLRSPISAKDILAFLDDLGCSQFVEHEVIQVSLAQSPNRFVSCVHGRLVFETKFARSIPSYEFLHNIELIRCMDKTPGFVKLVGVVVDSSRTCLKSFLIDFPRTKWSLLTHKLSEEKHSAWELRERWARQIVEAVRQVHANGFVIGTLWRLEWPIIVDALDRIYLWRFEKRFRLGWVIGCCYPPEFLHFRHLANSTNEADCPSITPKTDIFHLGMVLWHIAEGTPRKQYGPICMREGCYDEPGPPCLIESHIEPVALPPLSDSIPQYYRNIVDQCRAENPIDRPAAWRILNRFPDVITSQESESKEPHPLSIDPDSFQEAISYSMSCTYRHLIKGTLFHCNICDGGDFDICLACYDQGLHCYDKTHLLVEMEAVLTMSYKIVGKYHSCVDSVSGVRRVIEL